MVVLYIVCVHILYCCGGGAELSPKSRCTSDYGEVRGVERRTTEAGCYYYCTIARGGEAVTLMRESEETPCAF